jgi:hypothetical protein
MSILYYDCLTPMIFLIIRGSTSGTWHLRGYFYVHVSYNPDSCSPALHWFCRWASKGNVSITPCHPSYMALALTMTGLSPARMSCPSLGTQLPMPDPDLFSFNGPLLECFLKNTLARRGKTSVGVAKQGREMVKKLTCI